MAENNPVVPVGPQSVAEVFADHSAESPPFNLIRSAQATVWFAKPWHYDEKTYNEECNKAKTELQNLTGYLAVPAGMNGWTLHHLNTEGLGFFRQRENERLYHRYDFIHYTALLDSNFGDWNINQKRDFLLNQVRRLRNKEFYATVKPLAKAFMKVHPMYARRRVFHRDGRHYCERLEYTLFHPFSTSPQQQTFVYFKDTLALALLKADYETAHEIITLVGGWIYNGTGYHHDCKVNEAGSPHIPHVNDRGDPPMKDVSHTASFMEGYYRQLFSPNATGDFGGLPKAFVERHVFEWDWDAKYRKFAISEGMTDIERKHLVRDALLLDENPVWMTADAHLRRAEKMCVCLASCFMDYVMANPKD